VRARARDVWGARLTRALMARVVVVVVVVVVAVAVLLPWQLHMLPHARAHWEATRAAHNTLVPVHVCA